MIWKIETVHVINTFQYRTCYLYVHVKYYYSNNHCMGMVWKSRVKVNASKPHLI